MKSIVGFEYKGEYYANYKEANVEEITLKNGEISNVKLYNGKNLLLTGNYNGSASSECSFYLNGKLVRTNYSDKKGYYFYEFENGVNLSLKELEEKIKRGDLALSQKNYDYAIDIFTIICKNDYPATAPLNVKIRNSIANVNNQKNAYLQKLEKQKIAEEKRQEQLRITEERKQEQERIAEEKKQEKKQEKELQAFYSQLKGVTINYVVNNLKSPSTASPVLYRNPKDTKSLLDQSGNYLKSCEGSCQTMLTVDAQNSFGAYIRETYVVFYRNNRPCHMESLKEIDRTRNSQNTIGNMNAILEVSLQLNGCSCK